MAQTKIVILCGGSGTRLFPQSTANKPKQLLEIGEGVTLLHATISRMEKIEKDPILIMYKDQKIPNNIKNEVIYEEYINDTNVAVARVVKHIEQNIPLLFVPSDHYIENEEAFLRDIGEGITKITHDNIVLFGLAATSPETKYGYILDKTFIEKPKLELAKELIEKGALWNAGIFAAYRDTLYEALGKTDAFAWVNNPRPGKSASFDVAVLQKHDNIYCHRCYDWIWKDVGTYDAFLTIPYVKKDIDKHVVYKDSNNITTYDTSFCQHKIVVVGCDNLLISIRGDTILIVNTQSNYSDKLKNL